MHSPQPSPSLTSTAPSFPYHRAAPHLLCVVLHYICSMPAPCCGTTAGDTQGQVIDKALGNLIYWLATRALPSLTLDALSLQTPTAFGKPVQCLTTCCNNKTTPSSLNQLCILLFKTTSSCPITTNPASLSLSHHPPFRY